jgi:hypothetical protein
MSWSFHKPNWRRNKQAFEQHGMQLMEDSRIGCRRKRREFVSLNIVKFCWEVTWFVRNASQREIVKRFTFLWGWSSLIHFLTISVHFPFSPSISATQPFGSHQFCHRIHNSSEVPIVFRFAFSVRMAARWFKSGGIRHNSRVTCTFLRRPYYYYPFIMHSYSSESGDVVNPWAHYALYLLTVNSVTELMRAGRKKVHVTFDRSHKFITFDGQSLTSDTPSKVCCDFPVRESLQRIQETYEVEGQAKSNSPNLFRCCRMNQGFGPRRAHPGTTFIRGVISVQLPAF